MGFFVVFLFVFLLDFFCEVFFCKWWKDSVTCNQKHLIVSIG